MPDWKNIYQALFLSLVFFSLIGIDQFLIGHTVGGLLYWLGERSFTLSTPGIALNSLLGRQVLRAYSTFPHPNALAGYIGVSLITLYLAGFFNNNRKKIVGLFIILSCFLLTFSLTAFFAAGLIVTLLFIKNKYLLNKFVFCVLSLVIILSLITPIVSERILSGVSFDKNIFERVNLSIISGKISSQNFWSGTGLGTFTVAMTKVRPTLTTSWLLQPVHNIFLLSFSEVGIFGLLLLVFYLYRSVKIFPLVVLFVVITGFFDHYWLDSQQNLLLLALISVRIRQWKL